MIDGESGEYFSTVAGYIHLNPARACLFDLKKEPLEVFPWSSYPLYLDPEKRPEWLCAERVLGNYQWKDNTADRRRYREYMQSRVLEISTCEIPAEYDARWNDIRRGWFLGDEEFRKDLLSRIGNAVAGKRRDSFSGEQVLRHDEVEAERLVCLGLKALGLVDGKLDQLKKNCAEKYAIAWLVRRNTCVRNQWIKDRLEMGKATNFATFLGRMEAGEFGADPFQRIKNIKS